MGRFRKFAINENTALTVAVGDELGSTVGEGVYPYRNVEGSSVLSFYGTREDGTEGVIGNPIPKYYGGLTTTLSWKKLSVEALIDGAAGFDILDFASMINGQKEPYAVMEKFIHKGDYLRLRRVSAGYDFGKVALTLSGLNLLTLATYAGESPDVGGIDYGCSPYVRTVMLGVNLKF